MFNDGWEKADAKTQRSIILLTDGRVDVSKDKTVHVLMTEPGVFCPWLKN